MIEIFARDLHNQEDESYEEKREADETISSSSRRQYWTRITGAIGEQRQRRKRHHHPSSNHESPHNRREPHYDSNSSFTHITTFSYTSPYTSTHPFKAFLLWNVWFVSVMGNVWHVFDGICGLIVLVVAFTHILFAHISLDVFFTTSGDRHHIIELTIIIVEPIHLCASIHIS